MMRRRRRRRRRIMYRPEHPWKAFEDVHQVLHYRCETVSCLTGIELRRER